MSEAAPTTGLRLGTLNVWATHSDWEQVRRGRLRAGLAALSPDVFTAQETIVTPEYDQARDVVPGDYEVVHSRRRDADGMGISTISRWPVAHVEEVDLRLTDRTGAFPCTALITEILAPQPLGRLWVVNHFPDYQLDHEHERQVQAVAVARAVENLAGRRPGHVILSGDMDAAPDSGSIRFWTGREVVAGHSVCYRDAWASAHPTDPGPTYVPENPYAMAWDWPFRRIDYILVGCDDVGGPTLAIDRCDRIFDGPRTTVSDHYGIVADLSLPAADRAGAGQPGRTP